jgi:hypothetical protein
MKVDNLLVAHNVNEKLTFVYDVRKNNAYIPLGSPQPITLKPGKVEHMHMDKPLIDANDALFSAFGGPNHENAKLPEPASSPTQASQTSAFIDICIPLLRTLKLR